MKLHWKILGGLITLAVIWMICFYVSVGEDEEAHEEFTEQDPNCGWYKTRATNATTYIWMCKKDDAHSN